MYFGEVLMDFEGTLAPVPQEAPAAAGAAVSTAAPAEYDDEVEANPATLRVWIGARIWG